MPPAAKPSRTKPPRAKPSGAKPPRPRATRKASASRAAKPVARAPRRPAPRSIYQPLVRRGTGAEDLLSGLLSVAVPHAELLVSSDNPLATLMGERLRRAIERLAPLLEESMSEASALQRAEVDVAVTRANLGDAVRDATTLLAASPVPPPPRPVLELELESLPQWDRALRKVGDQGTRLRRRLDGGLRALLDARQSELKARLALHDTKALLGQGLLELLRVALECEKVFPSAAHRVVPRPVLVSQPPDPYAVH